MLQPGGLSRGLGLRLWRGEGAIGDGCPAAVGGGHWLLLVITALASGGMVGRKNNAGSALFGLGHQGKQLDQAAGLGSYLVPYKNQA